MEKRLFEYKNFILYSPPLEKLEETGSNVNDDPSQPLHEKSTADDSLENESNLELTPRYLYECINRILLLYNDIEKK